MFHYLFPFVLAYIWYAWCSIDNQKDKILKRSKQIIIIIKNKNHDN